jgi:hypothetical protein
VGSDVALAPDAAAAAAAAIATPANAVRNISVGESGTNPLVDTAVARAGPRVVGAVRPVTVIAASCRAGRRGVACCWGRIWHAYAVVVRIRATATSDEWQRSRWRLNCICGCRPSDGCRSDCRTDQYCTKHERSPDFSIATVGRRG